MKTITLSILFFMVGSDAMASEFDMPAEVVTLVNDITGAVQATKEAKTFVKNVKFNKISVDGSTITAEGMLLSGGDMACGNLVMKIEKGTIEDPIFGNRSTTYSATLDKSGILTDIRGCTIVE